MITTLQLPDAWAPWIEKKRIELGIKSRQAFILYCLKKEADIPEPAKPEDTWPLEDRLMRCPGCFDADGVIAGEHQCRTNTLVVDDVSRTRVNYTCVCQKCKSL